MTNIPGQPAGNPSDPKLALGPGTELKPEGGPTEGIPLPPIDPDDPNWTKNREMFEANMVHFDYDSAAIRSSERADVQTVADYMKNNPRNALLVEGHCDERGTDQYNYSLGERRALSVREALIAAGADGSRITTRTYGKDKKIALGNDEASHAKNRRGEFVVLTPK
jgi:peptidoglycan-associated lipoprotein